MGATDRTITLITLLKWSAPGGDVRLCDGGYVDHAGERYEAQHAVFGKVLDWPSLTAAMDDLAEDATITLTPAAGAALADWWRTDLVGTRVQLWVGELDADLLTVIDATQLGDLLVDTVGREQPDGGNLLVLDLISRTERLFLTDEGNVCSDRFHQSVWGSETGFQNCTDVAGKFAWGAAESTAEETSKGGKKKQKKNKYAS